MNEDSLVAVKTEKEHVGDVRFAHEKMRAKIGTDNSPHVCPVFRVKGRDSDQDLFRANRRSPLQENCTVILNCYRVAPALKRFCSGKLHGILHLETALSCERQLQIASSILKAKNQKRVSDECCFS